MPPKRESSAFFTLSGSVAQRLAGAVRCGGARLQTQAGLDHAAFLGEIAANSAVFDPFIEEDSNRLLLAPVTVRNRKLVVKKYFEFVEAAFPVCAEQPFAEEGLIGVSSFLSLFGNY